MRSNQLKRNFSALFGAIVLTTGLIASCSAITGKSPAETMSSAEPKMEMNHNGMNLQKVLLKRKNLKLP